MAPKTEQETSVTSASTDTVETTSSLKYAGFWRRYFAYTIDMMIIGIVNASVGFSFAFAMSENGQGWAFLPSLLISAGYFVYFWSKQNGQTLGNRILAIKVVKEDGTTLDPMTGVVRYLGYLLSGAVLSLGYLWSIWDSKKQGWHDKIAKTIVYETVEKPKKGLVALIFGLQFLFIFLIIGAIVLFVIILAGAANKNPDATKEVMRGVMQAVQEEAAEQDPNSEFARSLNEALQPDQENIDVLGQNVFTEINTRRSAQSLEVYKEENKMCAYAQRRLTQLTEAGKYDDGKGFYEDMGDEEIARAYFTGYGNISTNQYQLSAVFPNASDVVDVWESGDAASAVLNPAFDDACVRGNADFLVVVAAEKV